MNTYTLTPQEIEILNQLSVPETYGKKIISQFKKQGRTYLRYDLFQEKKMSSVLKGVSPEAHNYFMDQIIKDVSKGVGVGVVKPIQYCLSEDDMTKVTWELEVIGKPCNKFIYLNNWLQKYGNVRIEPEDVRVFDTTGKRNFANKSSNTPMFFIHEPEYCEFIHNELRKVRTTNDTFEIRKEVCIIRPLLSNEGGSFDEDSLWNGYEDHRCVIVVKTPTGRIKKELTISMAGNLLDKGLLDMSDKRCITK